MPQVVVVALLVMPMPSNAVRGVIQGAVSKLWHESEWVKKTSWLLLLLNAYYLHGVCFAGDDGRMQKHARAHAHTHARMRD